MTKTLLVILVMGTMSCGSKQVTEANPSNQGMNHEKMNHDEHHDGTEPNSGAATATSDVLPNDGTRVVGDVTTCPVTKDVFKISETSPSSTFEGKIYYFCCKGCVKDFVANPATFLSTDNNEPGEEHADASDHSAV